MPANSPLEVDHFFSLGQVVSKMVSKLFSAARWSGERKDIVSFLSRAFVSDCAARSVVVSWDKFGTFVCVGGNLADCAILNLLVSGI